MSENTQTPPKTTLPTPPLSSTHRADLEKSGISVEWMRAARFSTTTAEERIAAIGYDPGPAMAIPYPPFPGLDAPPFIRLKLDNPLRDKNGKPGAKYLTRAGAGNRLYIPPGIEQILGDPSKALFLVEGEKKALKASQEGFPTLGLAGVDSWKTKLENGRSVALREFDLIDWRSRPVYIAYDGDAATKERVKSAESKLAAELEDRGATVLMVRFPTPTQDEDAKYHLGCVFKLDDFLVARGAEAFRRLVEQAEPPGALADEETHVTVEPWPEPLEEAAFHGLAGRIVKAIEPTTEADPAALLVQLLVAFGNIIGRTAYFLAENDRHYCNLFAVIVGKSSKARKGTSWGRVKQFFDGADAWLSSRVNTGLSTGEGLIFQVRDQVVEERWIEGKKNEPGRMEEVVADAGVSDKRLLVEEPEFASVLKVASREGNTLSPTVRSAWDTGKLQTLTKNSTNRATGAHISIIGHITNGELKEKMLRGTEAGNGFGNRFLWVCSQRSKVLPESRPAPQSVVEPLARELAETVEWARTRREMHRGLDTRDDWRKAYASLSGDRHGLAGAVSTRAEAQVTRLSLIYALLDKAEEIRPAHLEAALAVWRYCEASARFIFGCTLGDPVADDIRQLLEDKPEGVTRKGINDHFKRNKTKKDIEAALKILLELDLAFRTKEATAGRPREVWRLKSSMTNKANPAQKGSQSPSLGEKAPRSNPPAEEVDARW